MGEVAVVVVVLEYVVEQPLGISAKVATGSPSKTPTEGVWAAAAAHLVGALAVSFPTHDFNYRC